LPGDFLCKARRASERIVIGTKGSGAGDFDIVHHMAADSKGNPNLNPATDPPLAAFANVGQNFKDGLPFTPWAAELRKQRMA
jgi:hypothetical protein